MSSSPTHTILDPKLDVVFKLLFSRTGNEDLLISLLSAVLHPPKPILSAMVLNPELPKEAVVSKASVLDVLVKFEDGTRVDVEIQMNGSHGNRNRMVYRCARALIAQLTPEELYWTLRPVVVVAFMNYCATEGEEMHGTYRLRGDGDDGDGAVFTDLLEVHTLELPKQSRTADPSEPELRRWVGFLRAESKEAMGEFAAQDPMIAKAKEQLEELSADPDVRDLARLRELAWSDGESADAHGG